MYQPAHGKFDGFRTSILPMLFEPDESWQGTFRGHLARGNPQWREIEASIAAGGDGAGEAFAFFDGPDAYISPAWYPEKQLTAATRTSRAPSRASRRPSEPLWVQCERGSRLSHGCLTVVSPGTVIVAESRRPQEGRSGLGTRNHALMFIRVPCQPDVR